MPILKDFRLTKEISLPNHEGSKVVIYNSALAMDTDEVMLIEKEPTVKNLLAILPKFIKSWNFTNEAGEEMPITSENLNFFAEDDLTKLVEEIKTFAEEVKKK